MASSTGTNNPGVRKMFATNNNDTLFQSYIDGAQQLFDGRFLSERIEEELANRVENKYGSKYLNLPWGSGIPKGYELTTIGSLDYDLAFVHAVSSHEIAYNRGGENIVVDYVVSRVIPQIANTLARKIDEQVQNREYGIRKTSMFGIEHWMDDRSGIGTEFEPREMAYRISIKAIGVVRLSILDKVRNRDKVRNLDKVRSQDKVRNLRNVVF